jgi:hypothetical protein
MEMRKRENEFIALYNSLKFNPGNWYTDFYFAKFKFKK